VEATSEARDKIWKEWRAYCGHFGIPPYLDGCDFQTVARVATMFGGRVRKGKQGKAVGAGMVRAGLRGVNMTITLERGTQPFHQIDGQSYIKPIQHMLAGFKFFDPITEKKLACHPDLPDFAQEHAYKGKSTAQHASGDLIVIAFYFLLRIGEYTAGTKQKKMTRTRQFQEKDVTFFKQKKGMLTALPRDAPAKEIMMVNTTTL
jgi:hypothetical protein